MYRLGGYDGLCREAAVSDLKLTLFGRLSLAGSQLSERMPLLILAYLAVEGPQDKSTLAGLFWDKQADETRRYKGLAEALRRIHERAPGVIEEHKVARTPDPNPDANPNTNPDTNAGDAVTQSRAKRPQSTRSAARVSSALNPQRRNQGTVHLVISSDARELEALIEAGQFRTALDSYQGRFLDGLETYQRLSTNAGVDWLLARRDYFQTMMLDVALRLGEDAAKQAQFTEAAELAKRAWTIDQDVAGASPDDLRRIHMLLLVAQDDQAEDVASQIRSTFEDIRLCEGRSEALARLERRFNVPRPPVLFGREDDLEHLHSLLEAGKPIITISGIGGIGKSALALALAERVRRSDLCDDGLIMVSLETLPEDSRPETFLDTFAQALGTALPADATTLESLADHVAGRSLLLLVDNAEHQLQHAGLISALQARCPTLTFVITSRQALTIQHEVVVNLNSLAFPSSQALSPAEVLDAGMSSAGMSSAEASNTGVLDAGAADAGDAAQQPSTLSSTLPDDLSSARNYPALALLIDGIEQRGSVVDASSLPDLVVLAQLSEGLPLALRLAAHWASQLPSSLVLDHFQDAHDLEVPQADIDTRHNSLTAAFDFSYNLLTAQQQQVLAALASFAGSFSHEAARAVSGGSAKTLLALSAAHLLMREGQRFRLHPLIKQYLLDKTDAQARRAAAMRHVSYYFEILRKHNETNTLRELPTIFAQDEANLRAAFEVGMQYEMWDVLAGGVSGWRRYYELREQFNLARLLLEQASDQSLRKWRAGFVSNYACITYRYGYAKKARYLAEKAYKLCDEYPNKSTEGQALSILLSTNLYLGLFSDALYWAELDVFNHEVDTPLWANAIGNLGCVQRENGDNNALKNFFLSHTFFISSNVYNKTAWIETNLGLLYFFESNLLQARQWLEQGISRQQTFWLARQKLYLSMVALVEGNTEEAQELCSFVLDSTRKSKRKVLHAEALIQQARIYLRQQQAERALEVIQQATSELSTTEMRNRQLQADMVLADIELELGKRDLAGQRLADLNDQRNSLSAFDQKGLDALLERANGIQLD
ncbi:MAG: bacterial transcriptional activator domain-containing protein [Deinococcota bacterium]